MKKRENRKPCETQLFMAFVAETTRFSRRFPFDADNLEIELLTNSNWVSLDGKKKGFAPKGKTYDLRKISREGEGKVSCTFLDSRIKHES